jgi:hypothetical protein
LTEEKLMKTYKLQSSNTVVANIITEDLSEDVDATVTRLRGGSEVRTVLKKIQFMGETRTVLEYPNPNVGGMLKVQTGLFLGLCGGPAFDYAVIIDLGSIDATPEIGLEDIVGQLPWGMLDEEVVALLVG